ncbi:MAG TPA: hypothetical protein LFW20_07360 [Rickettsia endosymbiont of Omalisus fontisbellaquei]|nr:hypothetical protein [Rickettsia endosymbiont of Omalisus fontisbellaquei]
MKVEIKSQEYKIFDISDDLTIYTKNLNEEIACSFFSSKLSKIALARNISIEQLEKLIAELTENKSIERNLVKVQVIGGDDSPESYKYFTDIVNALDRIDNNTDMINLIGSDTCKNIHPNSFEINGYHGGVRALD